VEPGPWGGLLSFDRAHLDHIAGRQCVPRHPDAASVYEHVAGIDKGLGAVSRQAQRRGNELHQGHAVMGGINSEFGRFHLR
jgi:hypothetical protein